MGDEDVTTANWTVSIDAGGTFTDAIARSDEGDVRVAKVASTPPHDPPSEGLSNAISLWRVRDCLWTR